MKERVPAEGFLPGDLIKEELEARGWTQEDLAEILGRTTTTVNEIITGKRGITVESAKGISEAFGTSAQFWLNMETAYRLSLEKSLPESISRKAFLYNTAPIRAMIKRNWIENSTNIEVLEQRLREFFGVSDLTKIPELNYMARKSTTELTPEQSMVVQSKKLSPSNSCRKILKKTP
jgi:HTH-type transcriptional regulator/antitoxin HigA